MNERSFDTSSGAADSGRGSGIGQGPRGSTGGELPRLLVKMLRAADERERAAAMVELLASQFPQAPLIAGCAWAGRGVLVAKSSGRAQSDGPDEMVSLQAAAEALELPPPVVEAAGAIADRVWICGTVAAGPQQPRSWTWWAGEEGHSKALLAVAGPSKAQWPVAEVEWWARAMAQVWKKAWQLEAYRQAAYTDPLTGLANRRAFMQTLRRELRRARRYGRPLSVLVIDLDGFRHVNELLGHSGGDAVLRKVGQWLGKAVRASDVVCRIGGDEFAVILPETGAEQARAVLERLRREIGQVDLPAGLKLSLSGGVAEAPGKGIGAQELLKIADEQLWQEKRRRRGAPEDEEIG